MTDADALTQAKLYIARLEEVVAGYALRYGLSDSARVVFGVGSPKVLASGVEAAPVSPSEVWHFAFASDSAELTN